MTEAELRNKAVTVAQNWLGAKEGSAQHKRIIDTYNGYAPRPRGYKVTYKDPWCAAFVSAVFINAGLTAVAPAECSCGELIKLAQKMGIWVEDDAYIPLPADLVLYDWQDSGKGDNKGAPDHVGIVETVAGGKTVTAIEGNYDNMVKRRMFSVDSRSIRGYICPDYASVATRTPEETTVDNAVKDIGLDSPAYWLEVLRGKRTASPANVKALMDKYHAAVQKK